MNKTLLTSSLLMTTAMALPTAAMEVTAGNGLDNQSTWAALKALITKNASDIAVDKTDIISLKDITSQHTADINALKLCGNQGAVYAPNNPQKDANGCVSAISDDVKRMLSCSEAGLFYSPSHKACFIREYRVCLQAMDHFKGEDIGPVQCTPWGEGMSDFAFDSDQFDPDGFRAYFQQRIRF